MAFYPNTTYIDQYIADGNNETFSLRNLYQTVLVSPKEDHVYRIPWKDFFIEHREDLDDIVQIRSIPEAWFYQPKTVSLDLYGTTELWLSLLRLNNMKNITEFHSPVIQAYNPDALKELMTIFFKREDLY